MIMLLNDGTVSKLTKNFSSSELECKCNKCFISFIDENLLIHLQILRNVWGKKIIVTSGYRCQEHNRSIKGALYSMHCRGHAADLVIPKKDGNDFIKLAKKIFPFVKVYRKKNFIHCDTRGL